MCESEETETEVRLRTGEGVSRLPTLGDEESTLESCGDDMVAGRRRLRERQLDWTKRK